MLYSENDQSGSGYGGGYVSGTSSQSYAAPPGYGTGGGASSASTYSGGQAPAYNAGTSMYGSGGYGSGGAALGGGGVGGSGYQAYGSSSDAGTGAGMGGGYGASAAPAYGATPGQRNSYGQHMSAGGMGMGIQNPYGKVEFGGVGTGTETGLGLTGSQSSSDDPKGHGGDRFSVNSFVKRTNDFKHWGVLVVCTLVVWFVLSSRDFSFLLTLSSILRCFGMIVMNMKMWGDNTASGLSVKTLQLYAVVFFTRLMSIVRHQGYLPYDKTGDWLYHFIEIISFSACCLAIYGIRSPLKATYDYKNDKFGNFKVPSEYGALYLLVPCVIMAVLFHPSMNREFFSDTSWTISMYLESLAMLPQLYMFTSQGGGKIDTRVGHMVAALGFSRVFELIFWVNSYSELVIEGTGSALAGYLVLLSQVVQLVIMGDFFYYYVVSLQKGENVTLPTHNAANGV